jgi:uncharacterized protein YutE (UPF0331/DUF86 family)
MIDRELVTRKILLIAKDVEALEELAAMTAEAFLAAPMNGVLAERYVERVVGRMIDVNYHLVTEAGQAPPPDYFQSFVQLATLGVYPSEFARRIAACAGLRNRIAHEYDDIDPRKLFDAVRQAVHDVPEYLRHVDAWIGR